MAVRSAAYYEDIPAFSFLHLYSLEATDVFPQAGHILEYLPMVHTGQDVKKDCEILWVSSELSVVLGYYSR